MDNKPPEPRTLDYATREDSVGSIFRLARVVYAILFASVTGTIGVVAGWWGVQAIYELTVLERRIKSNEVVAVVCLWLITLICGYVSFRWMRFAFRSGRSRR